jgi:caffeoyl-CoA O-methyltransferase
MGQIVPAPVDRYLQSLNRAGDGILEEIAQDGAALRLPLIDAQVGALLRLLAIAAGPAATAGTAIESAGHGPVSSAGARAAHLLEIGTAIGYSGLWLARGLASDGTLFTMEIDEERARIARANFAKAGVSSQVHVMLGDAGLLIRKVAGPFDLIFQDGPKRLYGPLLDPLVAKLRPGGLLVTHNVLWGGEVVPGLVDQPSRSAEDTRAIAAYNQQLNARLDLVTVTMPIDDGVSISVKKPL